MSFLSNFEGICHSRGESYSHACEAAGLSRAAYSKWKKYPDRLPNGTTVDALMKYFGCTYEQLVGRASASKRDLDYTAFINQLVHLNDHDFNILLSYAKFTWPDVFK